VKSKKLLFLGAGGHAVSCIDVIEQEGLYVVAGLVASASEVGKAVLGYPVIGTDNDLPTLVERYRNVFIAVGQIGPPILRIRLYDYVRRIGCHMPRIVSPKAYVSRHASVGEGAIVMHGAVVNAGAIVGNNCIINSHALVEHGAVIGDHCHVSTGVRVNGEARIGRGTFLGSGAVVRERVEVGESCIIGMGQLILADCEAYSKLPLAKTQ
jgi:sugar O-acyltransferase (sialic acid O-acetyltransferase NeuD family)